MKNKFIILICIILIFSCKKKLDSNVNNSSNDLIFNLSNSSWTFEANERYVDTLSFSVDEKASYFHAGIGVLFDCNYSIIKDTVSLNILDYKSQVDESKGKKTIAVLDLIFSNNKLRINNLNQEHSLFNHLRHKEEFQPNLSYLDKCDKNQLAKFAIQFNAADYGNRIIKTPDSLANTFDCFSKTLEYDILNKYLSLMMLKIYKHHLNCCEHSFELKNYEPNDGTPFAEYSHNTIAYTFFNVTDFKPSNQIHITSTVILEWLEQNPKLIEEPLISYELTLIDSLEKINIENDRF